MTQTLAPVRPSSRTVLVIQEIRNYATSPLFLIGLVLLVALQVHRIGWSRDSTEALTDAIAPAALIGLLGIMVMAGLTRRSDRAAEAAGATAVSESERTIALAWAVVVPVSVTVIWYLSTAWLILSRPPADWAVPSGPVTTSYVLSVIFAQSVMAAVGGPLLGLVIARWLRFRGAAALCTVLMVVVTMPLQGWFESTWRWHMVWPWRHWYGPLAFTAEGEPVHWVALPGSPQMWIVCLALLCATGVTVALYHDPEGPRPRLRTVIAILLAAAVVALVLTMVTGLPHAFHNPLIAAPA